MDRNADVLIEVDDFKNAIAIGKDLHEHGQAAPNALEIMAQWCATMREHYVAVGRELD